MQEGRLTPPESGPPTVPPGRGHIGGDNPPQGLTEFANRVTEKTGKQCAWHYENPPSARERALWEKRVNLNIGGPESDFQRPHKLLLDLFYPTGQTLACPQGAEWIRQARDTLR